MYINFWEIEMNQNAWKSQFIQTHGRKPTDEEFIAAQNLGFPHSNQNDVKSKKTLWIGIGVGVIAAVLIVGGVVILGNNTDNTKTSDEKSSTEMVQSEKSKSSSSERNDTKKTELPNLAGKYVAKDGSDATITSTGNQSWKIAYNTSEGEVFGTFSTKWQSEGDGFKADGKMSKLDDKYEFDYVAQATPTKTDGPIDSMTIEFSNGNPDHKMVFTNKTASNQNSTVDEKRTTVANNSGMKNPVNMSHAQIVSHVQELDWKHRVALIALGTLGKNLKTADSNEVRYTSEGPGEIGSVFEEDDRTSVSNVQRIVGNNRDGKTTGAGKVMFYQIKFGKITDDKYVIYVNTAAGASAKSSQISIVEAYREYWNDPYVEEYTRYIVQE